MYYILYGDICFINWENNLHSEKIEKMNLIGRYWISGRTLCSPNSCEAFFLCLLFCAKHKKTAEDSKFKILLSRLCSVTYYILNNLVFLAVIGTSS